MDFGALPPEINSGRMYAGPGAGPLLAAAAAWNRVAEETFASAASYQSVISALTCVPWQGQASAFMAAAAATYVAWLNATAGQAEQTASQAGAAAAAYEAAFAMTAPPALIATNRAQLTTLTATNFLGQNTPAIAATEAHYAEMWAQDAVAMYGYAGSSAEAVDLTSFTVPQLTGLAFSVPGHLQAMLTKISSPYLMVTGGMGSVMSTMSVLRSLMMPAAAAASTLATAAAEGLPRPLLSSATLRGEVSAGLGRATSVGRLSVPKSWGTATPTVSQAAEALSRTGAGAASVARAHGLGPMLGGPPLTKMAERSEGGAASRYGLRRSFVMASSPAAG